MLSLTLCRYLTHYKPAFRQPLSEILAMKAQRFHGMTGAPEMTAYSNAKARCTKPNHPKWNEYGGRGIKFLFTSFPQFYAELGARPDGMTLDRINNDGNYEPGNVRWATRKMQQNNRRNVVRRCVAKQAKN